MPTFTIKVAGRGTRLSDGNSSMAGHLWVSLNDGKGGRNESYGFGRDTDEGGQSSKIGKVHTDDDSEYLSTDFERTINITQEQYDKAKDFFNDPKKYGFDPSEYNTITNNCIKFVWKAVEVTGIDKSGFDGRVWPTFNIHDIRRIGDFQHPPGSTYVDQEPTPPSDAWKKLTEFNIRDWVNDLFRNSRTAVYDPLVLDLDGDGIERTGSSPPALQRRGRRPAT